MPPCDGPSVPLSAVPFVLHQLPIFPTLTRFSISTAPGDGSTKHLCRETDPRDDRPAGFFPEHECMTAPISTLHAEHYTWGDGCDGWHLVNQDNLSVIQERVPAGKSEQLHYHVKARQFFFVLQGAATLKVDGRPYTLHEREGLEVSPTIPHLLRNNGTADLVFLVISSPRSHGDRANV
jgi:mannose-6-phosphate isomerase-like protein (cupin superfamily)